MVNKEKLTKFIKNKKFSNILIDCGQGDKFIVDDVSHSEIDDMLILNLKKASIKWIEIDGKYQIELTKNNIRK